MGARGVATTPPVEEVGGACCDSCCCRLLECGGGGVADMPREREGLEVDCWGASMPNMGWAESKARVAWSFSMGGGVVRPEEEPKKKRND